MMYNTRYLPESFEQCRLEKTILRHFPYNLNVCPSFKMAEKNMKRRKFSLCEGEGATKLLRIKLTLHESWRKCKNTLYFQRNFAVFSQKPRNNHGVRLVKISKVHVVQRTTFELPT